MKKIILVNISGFGDLYLALPTLKRIKKDFPKSKLTFVCTKGFGIFANPFVDEIIEIDSPNFLRPVEKNKDSLKKNINFLKNVLKLTFRKFDLMIEFRRAKRTIILDKFIHAKNKIDFAQIKKWEKEEKLPKINDIYVRDEAAKIYSLATGKKQRCDFLNFKKNPENYIVLSPFSAIHNKDISVEKINDILKNISKPVYLVGIKRDLQTASKIIEKKNVINLIGKTDLKKLEDLILNSKKTICCDSFALHIAAMNRVPIELYINDRVFCPKRYQPKYNVSIKKL